MLDPRSFITYGACAALLLALSGAVVQTVRLAGVRTDHQADHAAHAQQLQRLAESARNAAAAAIATQQAVARTVAAVDHHAQQEMTRARLETDRIAAGVHAGTVRLRVAASCPARPAPGTDVPGAAPAPGVGDAAAAELDPAARPDYFALRSGIERCQAALAMMQGYGAAAQALGATP
jgi:prophage endopeptidase